jgi:hypothetical protein
MPFTGHIGAAPGTCKCSGSLQVDTHRFAALRLLCACHVELGGNAGGVAPEMMLH